MKRIIVPVLMITLLLLSGCAKNAALEKSFEDERIKWSGAQSLSFTADVVTELGDSRFECSLHCTRDSEGILLEVIKPENISGIRARLNEGKAQLEYEGIILAVEDSSIGETSPVAAVAMLMKALINSPCTQLWTETDMEQELVVAELYISEEEYARLWFLKENFTLIHAELVSEGCSVVKCKISSFTKE